MISINEKNNILKINWILNLKCNYNCSYCSSYAHNNYDLGLDFSIIERAILKLYKFSLKNNLNVNISYSGGEPMLYKNIKDVLLLSKNKFYNISMLTNCSLSIKHYEPILKNLNTLIGTIHFDYINDDKKLNIFLNKIKYFKENVNFILHLMLHPLYKEKIIKIKEFCDLNNIKYTYKKIIPLKVDNKINYSNKQSSFDIAYNEIDNFYKNFEIDFESKILNCEINYGDKIEKISANALFNNNLNKFKNWKCYAGINSLFIKNNGDVYGSICQEGGLIGNIKNDDFKLRTNPVICTKNSCNCISDIQIKKHIYF